MYDQGHNQYMMREFYRKARLIHEFFLTFCVNLKISLKTLYIKREICSFPLYTLHKFVF